MAEPPGEGSQAEELSLRIPGHTELTSNFADEEAETQRSGDCCPGLPTACYGSMWYGPLSLPGQNHLHFNALPPSASCSVHVKAFKQ